MVPNDELVRIHDREVEIRVVEKIEEARTEGELSTFPLRYAKSLLDCKIGVEVARAAVLVPPRVSVTIDGVSELRVRGTGS